MDLASLLRTDYLVFDCIVFRLRKGLLGRLWLKVGHLFLDDFLIRQLLVRCQWSNELIFGKEALENSTVLENHLPWAMLHAFLPFAFVNCTVCPVHLTVASALIIVVVALVHVTAFPSEHSVPMLLVKLVAAFVLVAVRLPTLAPLAFAMPDPAHEVSDIERAVFPLVLPEALRLAAVIGPLIGVSIGEEVRAMTSLQAVLKFALVFVAVLPDVHTVPLCLAAFPLPDVAVAMHSAPHSMALLLASVPLSVKDLSVAPGIDPFAVRLACGKLPNIDIAVLIALISLAFSLVILPLALVDPFLRTVDHHSKPVSLPVHDLASVQRLQVLLEPEIGLHPNVLPVIKLLRLHLVLV